MAIAEKIMSSLERKTRLETLEHISLYDLKRKQESLGFFHRRWALSWAVPVALAAGFALGAQSENSSSIGWLVYVGAGLFVLLFLALCAKQRPNNKEIVLAPSEALDRLLSEYNPIAKDAYKELQQAVERERALSSEVLEKFLAEERRAINEHLSPHTPWGFTQKSLED